MHTYIHTYKHIHTHTHTHARTHAHKYTYTHTHSHTHTSTQAHNSLTHIHSHSLTYTRTLTHTHHTCSCVARLCSKATTDISMHKGTTIHHRLFLFKFIVFYDHDHTHKTTRCVPTWYESVSFERGVLALFSRLIVASRDCLLLPPSHAPVETWAPLNLTGPRPKRPGRLYRWFGSRFGKYMYIFILSFFYLFFFFFFFVCFFSLALFSRSILIFLYLSARDLQHLSSTYSESSWLPRKSVL